MPYKGHVANGVIVLDDSVLLDEGTAVRIEVTGPPGGNAGGVIARTRLEHYRAVIGALDDAPEDWSQNHDKYLRDAHTP